MSNPYVPGTPEWQEWLNEQIATHDAGNKERDEQIDKDLRNKDVR